MGRAVRQSNEDRACLIFGDSWGNPRKIIHSLEIFGAAHSSLFFHESLVLLMQHAMHV